MSALPFLTKNYTQKRQRAILLKQNMQNFAVSSKEDLIAEADTDQKAMMETRNSSIYDNYAFQKLVTEQNILVTLIT